MSVEMEIWRIADQPTRIKYSSIQSEQRLEDILMKDLSLIDAGLMIIGRQVCTKYKKEIDLLAINEDGDLIVIELKKNRTPRDVVAQVLDYGSWVRDLTNEDIESIYQTYRNVYYPNHPVETLQSEFNRKFPNIEYPETLNSEHRLLIVASELDDSTERIVNYLSDYYGVAINAVFFQFFVDDGREYLTRAWLVDPMEAEKNIVEKRTAGKWSGEFYVNFGECDHRKWEDARKYGYIAAGGGTWYTKTLRLLTPGSRIWVKQILDNEQNRFVGVGIVTGEPSSIDEFRITDEFGVSKPIRDIVKPLPSEDRPNDEREWYVPVKWIKTFAKEKGVWEKGFHGTQHSVSRPKSTKWEFTLDTLKKRWSIMDE